MLKSANRTTLKEDRDGNELVIEGLVHQLTDPDPVMQSAAFVAIQASQDPAL